MIWSLETEPRPGRGLDVHPGRVSVLWKQVLLSKRPWALQGLHTTCAMGFHIAQGLLGGLACFLKSEKHECLGQGDDGSIGSG